MTESETTKLLGTLMALYPREEVAPERAEIYCQLLADLDADKARAAVVRVAATCKFFPTIAEIREEYATAEVAAQPAELAWAAVLAEVRRIGRYQVPLFSSEHVEMAVAAIGWEAICMSSVDDAATRAQFRGAYQAAITRSRTDVQTPAIARTGAQSERLGEPVPITAALRRLTRGAK